MNFKKMLVPLVLVGIIVFSVVYVASGSFSKRTPSKTQAEEETPERLMARAGWMQIEGKVPEAKQLYRQVLEKYPDSLLCLVAESRIKETGYDGYFKNLKVPQVEIVMVKPGDSLDKISREFNTTPGLIRMANGLKRDMIHTGMELKILKEPLRVLVDKSTNVLIVKAGDTVIKTYPVGTGKDVGTPTGEYKIENKLKDPTWYHNGVVARPNAPENPLGTRWMAYDTNGGYGIHGTTDRNSIGKYETLGCVRMYNEDVEELYELLPVGTPVSVIESAAGSPVPITPKEAPSKV